MGSQPRIGVYICHCGVNIAATVDVEQVTEFAATLPGVALARHYLYMCSDPGQGLIQEDIEELGLDGVVVASCSPRMHEPTFRGAVQQVGMNPYRLEMANIREQCSWVHSDRGAATEKAKWLVASVVAKAALPGVNPEEVEVSVNDDLLTIKGETKHEEKEEREHFLRRELSYGAFGRTLPLPASVDAEKATAEYEGGVLTITLPKVEGSRTKTIKIGSK